MDVKISKVIEQDLKEISEELRDYYDKISGKTFLIAGGAGFLGRYLVMSLDYLNEQRLLREPCKVIILDNFITGLPEWISEKNNIKLIRHDISQQIRLDDNVDYIINAASIASPVFYNKFKLETINVGFLGTKNLLDLAKEKKVESFLQMSSSEIYGNPDPAFIPTTEDYLGNVSCNGPRSCYDESKRVGEALVASYADIFNIPAKISRPFNIFGPGIRLDDGRVMPAFVRAALKGEKILLYKKGIQTRTFCYVSNAIVGFFMILLSEGTKEVYNIGADDLEINMKNLAEIIHGLVDNPDSKIHLAEAPFEIYKKADPDRRCPDLTKIRQKLGYNPKIGLIPGLRRFISWAKEELEDQKNS